MFNKCCDEKRIISYNISHSPRPINFSGAMGKTIKDILWYIPNIDSYQATKNDLVGDKIYDDFSFRYILTKMGMEEQRDVLWLEPRDCVSDSDWEFFENKICIACQKAIIVRCKSLSKTNDFLRCLRNCVAHGHFTVVNDYIIGFNVHRTKDKPEGVKKAIIKIKPNLLLDALKSLMSPFAKEMLIGYAFEKAGYTVIPQETFQSAYGYRYRFDLVVEKNEKKYIIEIKSYKGKSYLHTEQLERYLYQTDIVMPGIERVLFIDTSRITKAVREKEKEVENFRIVDLSQVKLLLGENPDDIFKNENQND